MTQDFSPKHGLVGVGCGRSTVVKSESRFESWRSLSLARTSRMNVETLFGRDRPAHCEPTNDRPVEQSAVLWCTPAPRAIKRLGRHTPTLHGNVDGRRPSRQAARP